MQGLAYHRAFIRRYSDRIFSRLGRISSLLDIPLEMGAHTRDRMPRLLGGSVFSIFRTLRLDNARTQKAVP